MIHWELCKRWKFDSTTEWYIHLPKSILENETNEILWNFEIQKPVIALINQKKKRICHLVDYIIPVDHRVKIRENEKRDKYLDFARELNVLWNMRVMVIPNIVDAPGTVPKSLEKRLVKLEIRVRINTIQTAALLKSPRILRRVLDTWRDLLSLRLQLKDHQLMVEWKTYKEWNNNK